MSPLSTTVLLQGSAVGGLLFIVYVAAVLYLFVLLVDIRRNTRRTAAELERLADALDAEGSDGAGDAAADGGGDAAEGGTAG